MQAGERGSREVAFYEAIEHHRQATDTTAAAAPRSDPEQRAAAPNPDGAAALKVMQRLAQWVPKSCECCDSKMLLAL